MENQQNTLLSNNKSINSICSLETSMQIPVLDYSTKSYNMTTYKETLEEVVEKITRLSRQDAFYEGAKWQEERTCKHIYTLTNEQGHRVIKCSKCNDTQPV